MNRSLMIDLGKKKKTWMNFKDYKNSPNWSVYMKSTSSPDEVGFDGKVN